MQALLSVVRISYECTGGCMRNDMIEINICPKCRERTSCAGLVNYRIRSLTVQCVLCCLFCARLVRAQWVSYYRMCLLTIEYVLLLYNVLCVVFSAHGLRVHNGMEPVRESASCVECVLLL